MSRFPVKRNVTVNSKRRYTSVYIKKEAEAVRCCQKKEFLKKATEG